MNWQKLLSYAATFIVGIILGYLIFSHYNPSPTGGSSTKVEYDTVYVEKIVKDSAENTNPVKEVKEMPGSPYQEEIYYDSLVVNNDSLKLVVFHELHDNQYGLKSYWDYEIKTVEKIVTKYVTKDSLVTVYKTNYLSTPWFMNSWFYVSIASFALTILALVF